MERGNKNRHVWKLLQISVPSLATYPVRRGRQRTNRTVWVKAPMGPAPGAPYAYQLFAYGRRASLNLKELFLSELPNRTLFEEEGGEVWHVSPGRLVRLPPQSRRRWETLLNAAGLSHCCGAKAFALPNNATAGVHPIPPPPCLYAAAILEKKLYREP